MSLQSQLDALLPPLEHPTQSRADHMRILLLDIETRPALTYQWTLWDKFTPVDRIVSPGGMLSWAAKWYGEAETLFRADWTQGGHAGMVEHSHELLCEADAVVTYNGDRFDLPWLRQEFLEAGLPPTSPFASVDLFRTVRQFRFLSKKLDYVCQSLDLGAKVKHSGFSLWTGCMEGDPEAQATMEAYNRGDVGGTLEPLYDALLPWIKGHPHVGLYADDGLGPSRCQRCGVTGLEPAGLARTPLGVYRRYRCGGCRSWHRGKTKVGGVDARAVQ